jgi:hypothetical protein
MVIAATFVLLLMYNGCFNIKERQQNKKQDYKVENIHFFLLRIMHYFALT